MYSEEFDFILLLLLLLLILIQLSEFRNLKNVLLTILTSGAETWTCARRDVSRLQVVEMKFICCIKK
jgi:hypothetical protein